MRNETQRAVIVGAARTSYVRHPAADLTTELLLADAAEKALAGAGLQWSDIDGLGVASFTLRPDHAIDMAWRMGLKLRWLMDDSNGGASGINMLQHAVRALQAGDAEHILLVSGDRFGDGDFRQLVDGYNRYTQEFLAALPCLGPNTQFAFLTQRQMQAEGLEDRHYGMLAVAQRRWAMRNEDAAYRTPLSIEDYLAAPMVAPPLRRYDCVPVVSGADAVVLSAEGPGVMVRTIVASFNSDQQQRDGLRTGLADAAEQFWQQAGFGPDEVDVASVYDDYPAMALVQLADLGFVQHGEMAGFIESRLFAEGWPLNTSGGMLSAGQAGAAAGLHGVVEAATQLLGRAGNRQVRHARTAVVSGYGMVVARYGAAANAVALAAHPESRRP